MIKIIGFFYWVIGVIIKDESFVEDKKDSGMGLVGIIRVKLGYEIFFWVFLILF